MFSSLDLGLKDKVAIVAGGGALGEGIGNGRAASILLAEAGVRVLVVDRDEELANNTVKMIKDRGGEALGIRGDLTQSDQCKRVVDFVLKNWGRLDILDNNIGIDSKLSVVDETEEYWDRVMEVNLKPMFLMSKYAIPAMINSGDGGSIVNISSISATRPKGLTVYSASKGAVLSLSQAMAVDHGEDGIRVNCILPGPVYTPMVYSSGMTEDRRSIRQNASLIQVEGDGWDIGKAVVYLSSSWARYVTGQLMVVDGGCSLSAKPRG
ncbi:SDR family oxidoreductase [Alphaproteobacteria bacterium]|jgi:NAD(P)-dependent dehydrogenase (short-subunit alcohol dehydrogenase family)|nr:SDR family oxidoreductase [Alphaproteobacteria bacterium]|tara:strand:- start:714 stop:1511 length:798 start_codon:yes stop_codon:yes gene_type:complete